MHGRKRERDNPLLLRRPMGLLHLFSAPWTHSPAPSTIRDELILILVIDHEAGRTPMLVYPVNPYTRYM